MTTTHENGLQHIDWQADPRATVARVAAAATRFETPCGTGKLVWHRWGARRPGNAPLVLLHGGSGSWTHWIKVIPALAAVTEIWLPDLPGLGDSAMPSPPYDPASCGQVVADGVRKLLPGPEPLHMIAFSFGAHVGTFAAAYLGDRLATFTICGSAALGLPHNRLEFDKVRSAGTPEQAAMVHRNNLAKLMFWKPERIDPLAIHLQDENTRRARFKSRPFAGTNQIPETVPHVTAQLRAIWGDHDILATPSVEARYDILRRHHPELQTRTLADCGHWVAYEQPEAFVTAALALTGLG